MYIPKKGDTIVILKHFFYEDITYKVYDEYPEIYKSKSFRLYPGRVILEFHVGQEYKVIGITTGGISVNFEKNGYCNLELEPSDLQPNRKNIGNRLEYLSLYKGGYVIEKSENRNRKLIDILKWEELK